MTQNKNNNISKYVFDVRFIYPRLLRVTRGCFLFLDSQADAGSLDDVQPVDLGQGRGQVGLDGQVGHDDERHGAVVGGVVAGVVLDDAGDADGVRRRAPARSRRARPAGRRS